jgi:GntR family transcriptional regulator
MRSEPTAGTVPVHHKIADALRAQIESGDLAPGDPIPTIKALQSEWDCAAITVRSALNVLRGEGRITGGRGKPAVVREPPQRIRLYDGFGDDGKALVLRPRSERMTRGAIEMVSGIPIADVISSHVYDTIPADDDLAREFDVPAGTDLQRRVYEMTDRKTGYRLSFSISYIPLELIKSNPDLLDETNEPWPGGHQHQLYTVGIELDRIVRSAIATEPTPGDRQKWGMEPGVPLLRIRSRSIDIEDRVVELSDATYPADRTEIGIVERLTRWPADYPRFDLEKGDQ